MAQHASRRRPAADVRLVANRRRILSDTLLILGAALLAVALVQLLSPGGFAGAGAGSSSADDSGLVTGVGDSGTAPTLPAVATLGAVVNPSIHLGASPTPVPFATLPPPTPTPSPGSSAAGSPGASPRVTPKPTTRPTPKPTPAPTPDPTATFDCVQTATDLTCTAHVDGATSWSWDWGDGASSTGAVAEHPFTPGTYQVTLTEGFPDGGHTTSAPQDFTFPGPT